jgi:hypothetical protein
VLESRRAAFAVAKTHAAGVPLARVRSGDEALGLAAEPQIMVPCIRGFALQ